MSDNLEDFSKLNELAKMVKDLETAMHGANCMINNSEIEGLVQDFANELTKIRHDFLDSAIALNDWEFENETFVDENEEHRMGCFESGVTTGDRR